MPCHFRYGMAAAEAQHTFAFCPCSRARVSGRKRLSVVGSMDSIPAGVSLSVMAKDVNMNLHTKPYKCHDLLALALPR